MDVRLEAEPDLGTLVSDLLSAPFRQAGLLADIGSTVIDISDELSDTLPLR